MLDLINANILVTGGAGFIGSNFIRYVFDKTNFAGKIINLDKLTYAGNPENLTDIQNKFSDRYFFEKVDICDYEKVKSIFEKYDINIVVHFAAESHVDRSIFGPKDFIETNINGTFNLIEIARNFWQGKENVRFHHISTDEVYGSLGKTGYFYETTPYDPRSPYSSSKAASDHLVRAYFHTYNLPMTISNCSNNYGPYQFPEKLIPVIILNCLNNKPIPIYGDGLNVRDWLYVEDHCSAIFKILEKGKVGETYNIGGQSEKTNLEIVDKVCSILDEIKPTGKSYKSLITFVKDRQGHDRRYAINCDKIINELGWEIETDFESGIKQTVQWYLNNSDWIDNIITGEYLNWIDKNYNKR